MMLLFKQALSYLIHLLFHEIPNLRCIDFSLLSDLSQLSRLFTRNLDFDGLDYVVPPLNGPL